MHMRYAFEPRRIRSGRGLYCDLCRKHMEPEIPNGYFRCLTSCNYDVCRDCGLARGGLDADLELLKQVVKKN